MTDAQIIAIHIILNDIKTEKEKQEFIKAVKKENKKAYDEYLKKKNELEKIQVKKYKINEKAIKDNIEEFKKITYYIPIALSIYHNLSTLTDEAKREYEYAQYIMREIHNPRKYIDFELFYWIDQHKEWENIITIQE